MSLTLSKKTVGSILMLLIAIAAGVFYWLKAIHPFETTDNAYLKAHTSLISPKEGGYVKEVLFEDNQQVKPGDLLVVIDDHDFQARVAQAEAHLLSETAHQDAGNQQTHARRQDSPGRLRILPSPRPIWTRRRRI